MVSPLVSDSDLATALESDVPPVLLDVRWELGGPPGIEEYRRGHIPGAVYVDLDRELAALPGPGRHPLPDVKVFEAAMRSHGVSAGSHVVVYDGGGGAAAARAWWDLRYFGRPDVRVLDGGFATWLAAGRPVATDEPSPEPGDFAASPGHMPLLDAASAAALAADGVLLDARAGPRYRGEAEPVDPVAGHIPGARSLPVAGLVGDAGRLLPADELTQRFAAAGAAPGARVGAYCGSGVTAAQEVLALAVAGIDAALYVGSWSDWITDPRRPIATGD